MHFITSSLALIAVFVQQIYQTAARPLFNRDDGELPTRSVFQFPTGAWVENIAVRSNGYLLVTRLDVPELFLLDPTAKNASAKLMYNFPAATSLTGIAETSPDKFAVLAGNFSLASGTQSGSWSIWTVDFGGSSGSCAGNSSATPKVSKVTDLSQLVLPNGMSSLSDDTVLVGDIDAGVIYGVNIETGISYLASTDPALALAPNPAFGNVGVNGIHVHENFLYFVTSGTNVLGRFPIRADGAQIGNASIIARALNSSDGFDDFAFDKSGNFFLTTGGGNSIEQVSSDGKGQIIAGSLNSTAIAEPTAAQFGRGKTDQNVLYVVTAGGLAINVQPGNQTVGGQVVAVDVGAGKP